MIGWDVGRVTTSASADAVEVGEKGRLAGCSLGRAKAHPYISEGREFGVGATWNSELGTGGVAR